MDLAHLALMATLGLSPIIWLVIALVGLKWPAHTAALGSLVVAAIASSIFWHFSPINLATAALEGFAMALWPIVIVIIAAVFTYNVTVETGSMEHIKQMLCAVSADSRVLVLIIAWCFGAFLEGMAGFGTAVAIPASMLVALGMRADIALLACLISNSVPTMFGSIGIPTTTLSTITAIDPNVLSTVQALQVAPFVIACPFLIVALVGGSVRAIKGVLPEILLSGVVFSVAEIACGHFIGGELPDIVGAAAALAALILFSLKRTSPVPQEFALITPSDTVSDGEKNPAPMSLKTALKSWSSFALIFIVLLLTSKVVPFIYGPLTQFKSTVNIFAGDPTATLTFSWVNTPGVLIMLCGIVGGLIQGASAATMCRVFAATCKQMSKTILTMLGVLAVAKIMGYSGMIASIAAFFVTLMGPAYPLVSPVLGALGTFVTGSGTSSEVLFGAVQINAAHAIGADPTWLAAANSLGVSAGKMISPQNIAIGCASVGLAGKDGEILSRIAPYALGFIIVMAALVFGGAALGI